jgi:hypothetical protein
MKAKPWLKYTPPRSRDFRKAVAGVPNTWQLEREREIRSRILKASPTWADRELGRQLEKAKPGVPAALGCCPINGQLYQVYIVSRAMKVIRAYPKAWLVTISTTKASSTTRTLCRHACRRHRLGDLVLLGRRVFDLSTEQDRASREYPWPSAASRRLTQHTPRRGEHLGERKGDAYARDGLQTILWKVVKALVTEGLVRPGLCFHGLRHSLGTALYDLGLDREARKAALGHTSDAASIVYERGGDRRAASDRAFAALDAHNLWSCGQGEERQMNRRRTRFV